MRNQLTLPITYKVKNISSKIEVHICLNLATIPEGVIPNQPHHVNQSQITFSMTSQIDQNQMSSVAKKNQLDLENQKIP